MRNAVTNETMAKGEKKARSVAWLIALIVVLIAGLVPPASAQILKTDFTNPAPPPDRQANNKDWASNVCGGSTFMNNPSPIFEWGPVFGSEFDTQLVGLSGTIPFDPTISGGDVPFTHPFGTDWEFFVIPDDDYVPLLAPSNGCTSFTDSGECVNNIEFTSSENAKNSDCTDAGLPTECCTAPGAGSCNINVEFREAVEKIHSDKNLHLPKKTELGVQGILGFETDQGLVPSFYRDHVKAGDRVVMFGRWIADCGHPDFHTEMHPPLVTAFGRATTGADGQPQTTTEVISRPYLTSQTFEDGKGIRHHMFNELVKGLAVPACEPFEFLVNKALHEDVGCRDTVCIPIPFTDDQICHDVFCDEVPRWFTLPCTTRFEAHQNFEPKPFNFDSKDNGPKSMSYIVSPPIPRQCEKRKLLVSTHFTVRHGVTATVEPAPTDAARVTITMDEREYTQPPLPPKADLSFSIDDIRFLNSGTADKIEDVRLAAFLLSPVDLSPLFSGLVGRGLLTDCYDPSYGILGPADHPVDTFPDCAALKPLTASSPVDSKNEVVAKPIDELSGPVSAEDNSNSQVFPIYGHLDLEWSQEKFPPKITITQPMATTYVHSDTITLDYSAADTGCGVSSVTATMDGAPTLRDGQTLGNGQTISLVTGLTLGDHTFTVSAGDNVGGTNSVSVTFSIIVTADSIKNDVLEFLQSGAIKNGGEANSLLAKLDAGAAARARGQCSVATHHYESFINELQAQGAKGVDATAAAIMIADAQYLITHCP